MSEKEKLILSIKANMMMVSDFLEDGGSHNKLNSCKWWSVNRKNTELRQRMKLLRKDMIKLEKLMLSE